MQAPFPEGWAGSIGAFWYRRVSVPATYDIDLIGVDHPDGVRAGTHQSPIPKHHQTGRCV